MPEQLKTFRVFTFYTDAIRAPGRHRREQMMGLWFAAKRLGQSVLPYTPAPGAGRSL
jgi:hypothetical protein